MSLLKLSENIMRLRREKGITQEQLADFIGVTKASVSKWETRQSLPDLLLLPQLAAYFDVTIDELLGYEPQLSREQIRKLYHGYAADYATKPFEEVMAATRATVKQYYSCYSLLFYMAMLWMNHHMLAADPQKQAEILEEGAGLCDHILEGCKDIGLCQDTMILKALMNLQLGKAGEVIEELEGILAPTRLASQSNTLLAQAYMLAGRTEDANRFTQISMFLNVLLLVNNAAQYLEIHAGELAVCDETIRRIEELAAIYKLDRLNPNVIGTFRYQAALVYCMHGNAGKAMDLLKRYVDNIEYLLAEDHLNLHGDDYFDQVSGWYDQLDLGAEAPRDRRVIMDSFMKTLENPAFAVLEANEEFKRLKNRRRL